MATIKEGFNFEKFELIHGIAKGDWNFRFKGTPQYYKQVSKSLAIVKLANCEISFTHKEIMDAIKLLHDVDMDNIRKIKRGESGLETKFETPFVYKLMPLITNMKEEADNLNGGKSNGQTTLI